MIWAILPVKPLNRAKSRLASVLSPEVRVELATALLKHTLCVLTETKAINGTLVISRDTRALVIARQYGAKTVQESGAPELNLALQRASQVIASWGARSALILPADLPLINWPDLQELTQLGRYHNSVVVAPDRRDDGTNSLLVRPPGIMQCAFGTGSFARHVQTAKDAGATVHVFRSERIMLDLDTPQDLLAYLDYCEKQQITPLMHFALDGLKPPETAPSPDKETTP